MIEKVIQNHTNQITEVGFNIINKNLFTQKVKEISENTIFSIGTQTLIGSLALRACGISFATSFPLLLALVVAKIFMTTLNHAKTVIKATLNDAKTVIQITAQKAASPFMRVAEVINDIFKKVCVSFASFAMSSYHLIKNIPYSSPFKESNDCPLPIKLAVIEKKPIIEQASNIVKDLAKPPSPPSCDSLFLIQEKDSEKELLLRGIPFNTKEEIVSKFCFLKSSIGNRLVNSSPLLLKKDSALWIFFLEQGEQRLLKNPTSERFGTTVTALKDVPEALFLEGIPVRYRSPL